MEDTWSSTEYISDHEIDNPEDLEPQPDHFAWGPYTQAEEAAKFAEWDSKLIFPDYLL